MPFMTRDTARALCSQFAIDTTRDFHSLSQDEVARVLEAAKACKYVTPKNANGSKARYFHAYLRRSANRKEE